MQLQPARKLHTGKAVFIRNTRHGKIQAAQVMSNGFTVHFTRGHDRDVAASRVAENKKADPLVLATIEDMKETGIGRSGFHLHPTKVKAGYVEVLIEGKHVQTVKISRLLERK